MTQNLGKKGKNYCFMTETSDPLCNKNDSQKFSVRINTDCMVIA